MATETYTLIGRSRWKNLRLGRLLSRSIWGLGDQALISASNFLTTVVLARRLSPANFGAFALLYAAVFFMVSLQTTLVSRPHNVLGVTRQGEDYRRYTAVTAVSQLCLTAIFALVALSGALFARHAAWGVTSLLFPLVLVVVAWQLQEFTRRVLYTEGRLRDACANDLISYGGQAVGIVALGQFGQLTGARALSVIALTSAAAAAYGAWQIRGSLMCQGVWDAVRAHGFAENWRFGRWLFGAALAAFVAGQLYPILVGGFISVAEAGAFSAVFTLMGPARILLIAMDTALVPVGARAFAEKGQPGLQSFVGRVFLGTAPIIAVYCIGVSLFAPRILGAAYGDHYRPYGWLLALFALSYALDYLRHPISIALEARRSGAPIFRAYLASAIVVLTLGIAAVRFLGLLGAALGTIANSLILGAMLWQYYHHVAIADVPTDLPEAPLTRNRYFVSPPTHQQPSRPIWAARPRPVAAHTQSHRASRLRTAVQSAAIPLWEKGFAVLGIFLCLDAGVRTLRILGGTEGPIQSITSPEVDYSAGSTLTQILLFAVYLVSVMLLLINPTRQLKYAFKAKLIWLLPALAMVSVLWSGAPSISLRRAVALLGSTVFAFYLGTRYSRADLLRLFLAVSVIATTLTLLTVVALPTYAIDDSGAWQGVFGQKNHLGRFMALSAVLWLLYALTSRRQRFLAGFSVVSVAMVLLSHSATSVALLFALAAVLLLIRLVRVRSIAVAPILALIVVVGGYLATVVVRDPGRVTALLGRDASLTGRTQLWGLVWQLIQTHLWHGYGYGGFWLGFDGPSAAIWSVVDWNPPNAHNGFLDLLLDLGIPGAIIMASALLIAIRYAVALARRGRTLDAAFPLIFLVFYLLSNLTESYLVAYNTESWVLFVAITIQLHMWWHGEGRMRPQAARASATFPPARPVVHHVSAAGEKERFAFQEGPRMSGRVTISAIMPTYNAMPYVEDAIESVLAQTFTDWELIIVDDGSTDETRTLLARYTDPRIRVFELEEHGGIANARNIALGFACGTYIAITESDSHSLPDRFAREVAYLDDHAEVHVVSTQIADLSARELPRPRVFYPEDPEAIQRRFARGKMAVPFPAAMIRSWCFDRFGHFRADMRHASDLEWFLRIRRSCNFRVLPEVLCLNSHHSGGVMFSQWIVEREYERYAAYRAKLFGSSADRTALSFDRFTRRWGTRFALYTRDAMGFLAFRREAKATGRRLK